MATNRGYAKKNRRNKGTPLDSGAIQSYQANPYSGGQKNLPVGPEFLKDGSNAYVSGRDVSSGGAVMPGSTLWVFNNSGSVAWLSLSTATIGSAPSAFTDGIPLKPNDWTILSAGENSFVRSSAATVGLYEMKDDTNLVDESS